MKKNETCMECGAPADYIRHTQFAGNHPFCEKHAKEQTDFGVEDPSYFFWEKLNDSED